MSGKKIAILLGLVFFVLGAALIVVSGIGSGFRYDTLSRDSKPEQTLKSISEPFDSVEIRSDIDVQIQPAVDGSCVLSVWEDSYRKADVELRDGLLKIEILDKRPWYRQLRISVNSDDNASAVLYLPERLYRSLSVTTSSGDTEVTRLRADSLEVSASSGEIQVSEVQVHRLVLQSVSGDVDCFGSETGSLSVTTTSGEIDLNRLSADTIQLQSTSGDVHLKRGDAALLQIQTTSGDVGVNLTAPMLFAVHTTSGEIEVPAQLLGVSDNSISTVSGDIEIELE